MEWFTCSDVRLHFGPADTMQTIVVMANTIDLLHEIPIAPRLNVPESNPPPSTLQWCGKCNNRIFIIECEANVSSSLNLESNKAAIYSPFLNTLKLHGDWAIIAELKELPKSIFTIRPFYIESRETNPKYAVYRPDPKGWNYTIYTSSSHSDAEGLLNLLQSDQWNSQCFIGDVEPIGEWRMTFEDQSKEHILGVYSEKNSALKVACAISLQLSGNPTIIVQDCSTNQLPGVYRIYQGKVV